MLGSAALGSELEAEGVGPEPLQGEPPRCLAVRAARAQGVCRRDGLRPALQLHEAPQGRTLPAAARPPAREHRHGRPAPT